MTNKQVVNMLLKIDKIVEYDNKNLIIFNNYSFIQFKNEHDFNIALLLIKNKIENNNKSQVLLNFINDLHLNETFEYKVQEENKINYAFINSYHDYYFMILNKAILKEKLSINYNNRSFALENDSLIYICMLSKKI